MTLNGRPDRGLSNSKPSTAKRRTHRSTVVRVLSVARSHRLILLADAAGRAPHVVVQSGEPCANQSKYRQWQRASGSHGRVQDSSCGTHTMSIGMDNTTKAINQPLVRNRSNTTLGEVVGKVGILSKVVETLAFSQNYELANKHTHCQRKATATDVGPSTLGIQRRITSDTCPTLFTQLRSNTNKSLITLSLLI